MLGCGCFVICVVCICECHKQNQRIGGDVKPETARQRKRKEEGVK